MSVGTHTHSSKPFSNDREGTVEGELPWVWSSVGQEQGPGLSDVAGLVEVTGGLLHIPFPLSQHVRDQWRIQSWIHTTDQHPSIQQQRQELRVTHIFSHLQRERKREKQAMRGRQIKNKSISINTPVQQNNLCMSKPQISPNTHHTIYYIFNLILTSNFYSYTVLIWTHTYIYTLTGHFIRYTCSIAWQHKLLISQSHGSNSMHLGI